MHRAGGHRRRLDGLLERLAVPTLFEQAPARRQFAATDQPAWRGQVEPVRKPVPGDHEELGFTVQSPLQPPDTPDHPPVPAKPAGVEVPDFQLREQRRTRSPQVRLVHLDPAFLDTATQSVQFGPFGKQLVALASVAKEIAARLFALDHDGARVHRVGPRRVRHGRPPPVRALVLAVEVSGDVDPVSGDRAADLGGNRPAAECPQESDRKTLQLQVGGCLHQGTSHYHSTWRPRPREQLPNRYRRRLQPCPPRHSQSRC